MHQRKVFVFHEAVLTEKLTTNTTYFAKSNISHCKGRGPQSPTLVLSHAWRSPSQTETPQLQCHGTCCETKSCSCKETTDTRNADLLCP